MIKTSATITQLHHSPSTDVVFALLQLDETFTFLEGQFMMMEADCYGQTIKKPYSIATTNQQLLETKQIGFYIKKASEQWLSARLTKDACEWDTVSLQWPVGHFTDSHESNQYLLISTGSGLSPNLGLFQHLVYEWQPFDKIVQLFGEKTTNHLVDTVQTLLTAHGRNDKVTTLTTLSQEDTVWYHHWRVQNHIDEALSHFTWKDISVFLCGAPVMVKEVQQILLDKGIDKQYITTEKW